MCACKTCVYISALRLGAHSFVHACTNEAFAARASKRVLVHRHVLMGISTWNVHVGPLTYNYMVISCIHTSSVRVLCKTKFLRDENLKNECKRYEVPLLLACVSY